MSASAQPAAAAPVRIRPYSSADAAATRDVFSRAVKITAASHYTTEQRAAWAAGSGSLNRWNADRSAHHTLVAVEMLAESHDDRAVVSVAIDASPGGQKGLMAVRTDPEGEVQSSRMAVAAPDARRDADHGTKAQAATEHIVGYVDFRDSGYIDHLFVAPNRGRQGVASQLLTAAIARARDHGAVELTSHASLVAIPVFERQGFTVVHREQVLLRGQSFDRALMRLALDDWTTDAE
ncbi:GNAT family N-acetyltransferase [Pseudoclavibacter sp. 13-3]|uniref:GNAT family N-acetyltransferase n=1 Tax=Pseudoclavibacter sp. 13-3 TaxID=2901228 RepID=UPI001E28CAFF|nr:GNAT family N-acetyltransferase [Pseudoclavibacter sp. 13-3]MCD7102219.1 GNAT family N-acetyltransferase [Pseudoclavibacter sp. 13-3]